MESFTKFEREFNMGNYKIDLPEKAIEEFICTNPDALIRKMVEYPCKVLNQFDISPYGVIDILALEAYSGIVNFHLIEIKARPIKADDLIQMSRYVVGIMGIWEQITGENLRQSDHIWPVLVTEKTEDYGDIVFLLREMENHTNFEFYEYEFSLETGLIFSKIDHKGWIKTGDFREKCIEEIKGCYDEAIEDSIKTLSTYPGNDKGALYYEYCDLISPIQNQIKKLRKKNKLSLDVFEPNEHQSTKNVF